MNILKCREQMSKSIKVERAEIALFLTLNPSGPLVIYLLRINQINKLKIVVLSIWKLLWHIILCHKTTQRHNHFHSQTIRNGESNKYTVHSK